ncbi:MCE family protein [Nocardia sp. XZ_19_385]|uniref:MCE family protein n=1 Tax=Nocardia sp. XZ_19_385 TaxID=2769488 RepID=UPI00188FECB1|nr:MCE family protein [Nocardia sp. XZ_19_385]
MKTIRGRKRVAGLAIGLAIALGATGCQWDGLNSLPLPGAKGTGEGAWEVKIQMPNVTTLNRNSPVRVNDVTVGTVTGIEVEGWHALVTVSLEKDVTLPANATAKIGQTSLLGSNHVELAAPKDVAAQGRLQPGGLIPLERAGAFPTTEQVLSSLSVVLNGGGISQLQNITGELNKALVGNTDAIRDLLPQLNTLIGTLDTQTKDIIAAMSGLDRFSGILARQQDQLASAIENIHPALTVLADRRETITQTLTALGGLSDVVSRIVDNGGDNLTTDLANLWPLLDEVANTGNHLSTTLGMLLTFPFSMHHMDGAVRGDYLNVKITYDLTSERLSKNFLTGTPLGKRYAGVEGVLGQAGGTDGDPIDPTTAPMREPKAENPQQPSLPGLGPIPGLPAIPGITVPEGSGK